MLARIPASEPGAVQESVGGFTTRATGGVGRPGWATDPGLVSYQFMARLRVTLFAGPDAAP